jgi:O-antigen/teichoic acid export membrane protein
MATTTGELQPISGVDSPIIAPPAADARALALRFAGYLSADGLNYALGFLIYGLLVRVLTNAQYGELSIATTIYQAVMMVAALGLDLTGPAMLARAGGDPMQFIARAQRVRLSIACIVCAPLHVIGALYAWQHGNPELARLLMVSLLMVLARAFDLTYAAVALRLPGPLARTRALGLGVYLVLLVAAVPLIRGHLWLVPCLNAFGVTLGRVQLARFLRRACLPQQPGAQITTKEIVSHGIRAGSGQLLLLMLQTMDVVLLARYASADAVGQYGMASRLYLLGTAVLVCLLNTFLPELVGALRTEAFGNHFRRFALASLALGVLGSIGFYAFGARVSEALAHRGLPLFHSVGPLFALVFLLMGVASPFLNILPSIGRPTAYVVGIASAAVLLFACDLALMPKFGVVGAAWSQVVATGYLAIFTIIQFIGARRHSRFVEWEDASPMAPALNL